MHAHRADFNCNEKRDPVRKTLVTASIIRRLSESGVWSGYREMDGGTSDQPSARNVRERAEMSPKPLFCQLAMVTGRDRSSPGSNQKVRRMLPLPVPTS